MKKLSLTVLFMCILLLSSCSNDKSNENRQVTAKYNFESTTAVSDYEKYSKDIEADVALLNYKRVPIKNDKPLIYSSKDNSYYIHISNKSIESVNCTIFAYFNKRLIPINVNHSGEAKYYNCSLGKGEDLLLPISMNLKGIAWDNPERIYICTACTAATGIENLKFTNSVMWGYSTVFCCSAIFKSESPNDKKPVESNEFFENGIESKYVNKGLYSNQDMVVGLSFGDKIDPENDLEMHSYLKVKKDNDLYLRCQLKPNSGLCSVIVFIDNIPVKAFNNKYFASFNQGKENAYSFLINSSLITKGEHTMYAVSFYDDNPDNNSYMQVTNFTLIEVE